MSKPPRKRSRRKSHTYGVDLSKWHEFMKDDTKEDKRRLWLARNKSKEKARQTLINTIAKIYDLEPTLGGKWRLGMLRYYSNTLAELMLTQMGIDDLSPINIAMMGQELLQSITNDVEI